ncbi:ankyrin repeat-containing domain protein [Nemania sp. FL0031]|nr:ankyrin repeat-containing domain protein [Nemania sp. FL0031]
MVNIRNDNEKTPLHSVFDLGDSSSSDDDKIIAIVTALLEKGADTGATESLNGETPLHMAARKETPGGVGALLPKANVNSRNNRGYTPLSIAIRHKQIEIVHLMLDKADPEADLKLKGPMDNLVSPVTTVLETAICKGNIEIVKLFLQPTRSTLRYIDTPWESVLCTPLTWAVHEGNFKLTEILLESGARIDVEDKNSDSPLRLSSSLGNIDITELLLKYNPRVDLKEHGSDWTALHYASYYGHHKITELIVKKGADARLGQPKAPRKWTITEFPQVVV